jgi:hypothetical protein
VFAEEVRKQGLDPVTAGVALVEQASGIRPNGERLVREQAEPPQELHAPSLVADTAAQGDCRQRAPDPERQVGRDSALPSPLVPEPALPVQDEVEDPVFARDVDPFDGRQSAHVEEQCALVVLGAEVARYVLGRCPAEPFGECRRGNTVGIAPLLRSERQRSESMACRGGPRESLSDVPVRLELVPPVVGGARQEEHPGLTLLAAGKRLEKGCQQTAPSLGVVDDGEDVPRSPDARDRIDQPGHGLADRPVRGRRYETSQPSRVQKAPAKLDGEARLAHSPRARVQAQREGGILLGPSPQLGQLRVASMKRDHAVLGPQESTRW